MEKKEKFIPIEKEQLPNNFLAEQSILNILLNNPFLIKTIYSKLSITSFYFESHKLIYEIILELFEKNFPINLTNIISKIQDKGLLQKIGGISKIKNLLNQFSNKDEIEYYVKVINEKYYRRVLINLGKQIIKWGYTTSEELEEIIEKTEEILFSLNQEKTNEKVYTIAEIVEDVFSEIKGKINKNETVGYETSFKDLDTILQGLQKSDLIIIAGRPSMGKTAFSLNIGKNIVEKYQIPLIIFSLEMSRQQIIYRLLSTEANINSNRIKTGKMTALEWKNLSLAMQIISNLPVFIDDNPNISLIEIKTTLKEILGSKKNSGVIIIDYLQLMKLNFKLENRVQEISYITRGLKILAKEFEIPILLLSQLSRSLESRVNKRPMLSDLRESGCVSLKSEIKTKNFILWNKKNFYNFNSSTKTIFRGIKPIFILNFEKEKKVYLTSNHKILSKNGWISVSQINFNNLSVLCFEKNNFCFKSIKKIEYKGLDKVYERTIPIFHNYMNNNLFFHNSIEQDADVVIMIYREDYYNEKTNGPQLTELIVSKHRNGPTGTAQLLFYPSIASFKNIENAKNQT